MVHESGVEFCSDFGFLLVGKGDEAVDYFVRLEGEIWVGDFMNEADGRQGDGEFRGADEREAFFGGGEGLVVDL